ncbi:MAG: putative toxin-antitoxin system toxin component, PIN family [Dehalococcoidia bacterium]|nr:putative toxin-antitoxin system toxin component, PIN family [Dehalococcoidia bacterium]
MRVVLDTNVIISALNFPGNERLVLDLARRNRFDLFLSPFILGEVSGVLTRKFGWDGERVTQALSMLRATANVIEPQQGLAVVEGDHADNRILECALAASADYLVTGDRRHLLPLGEHRGTTIVNAPQFLTRLERDA